MFKPSLFIDIGADNHFYTLRETYLHTTYTPGPGPNGNAIINGVYQGTTTEEVRSFHHFNLSQNPEDAIAKAREYASRTGLTLHCASVDELYGRLNDVKRQTADEKAKAQAAYEERNRFAEEERLARLHKALDAGIAPFGQHAGTPFAELPYQYKLWIVSTEFEPGSYMDLFKSALAKSVDAPAALPKPHKDQHAGEIGKRQVFETVTIGCFKYVQDSYNGWGSEIVHITTLFDKASGCCLMVKSTSFSSTEGEELKIKATVKAHNVYKDQAQTVIQRVTIL